ncbi:MAG TPA: STAS domain-containing protein [Steroidobacteraceae bacterium]|nr:STAS domain-containing protein [Steroidobacteraceae bacterium]
MRPEQPQVGIASPGRVTVASPLTFPTARRVCEAGIACFLRDGSSVITVDCAGVPGADSAGLAVLIEWRRWARERGRDLNFVNLPAQISAIARLSEVSALLADKAS